MHLRHCIRGLHANCAWWSDLVRGIRSHFRGARIEWISQPRRSCLAPGAGLLVALFLCQIAAARDFDRAPAARNLFRTANGFWLVPSDHSGALYGPTSPDATWNIVQWGIPKDLPPFRGSETSNEYAKVVLAERGGVRLEQVTSSVGCDRTYKSGRKLVSEFDLFVAPNGQVYKSFPSASSGPFPALSEISRVEHQLKISSFTAQVIDHGCALSQVALTTALVLANPSAKQTLFYQIRLAAFRTNQGKLKAYTPGDGWFFSGENTQSGGRGQYGFTDDVSKVGGRFCEPSRICDYNLELYGRMVEIIRLGRDRGMDPDLSHWILRSTYHGGMAFGHVALRATWSGFALNVK
jgi:hypothetical protein